MYQTVRKIHLWIGLILSVVILLEAVTGLILAEPWIIGQAKNQRLEVIPHRIDKNQFPETNNSAPLKNALPHESRSTQADFSAIGLAKSLHQGRYDGWNFKWLIDVSAVGLILLTVTGIYISVPLIRTHPNKRN